MIRIVTDFSAKRKILKNFGRLFQIFTHIQSDGADTDRFGWSVAVSGETAIVGSHFDDIGTNTNQGSAYIFARSGTTWSEQQKLTASDGAGNDNFGRSVAISGNAIIVGADMDDIGTSADQGSCYVFVNNSVTSNNDQTFDFDDHGKSDLGVFRPSNSTWFVNRSTAGTLIQSFGIAGDVAVPNAFIP